MKMKTGNTTTHPPCQKSDRTGISSTGPLAVISESQNPNESCLRDTASHWIDSARQIFPRLSDMLEDMECPRSFEGWRKTLPNRNLCLYVHDLWKQAGRPQIDWPPYNEMDCNGIAVAVLCGSLGDGGILIANVPSDLSLLAFGIPPAREADSAGGMPKVPKGQGLGPLARSNYFCSFAISRYATT